MTCVGHASINRPSQDYYTTLYSFIVKRSVAVIAIPLFVIWRYANLCYITK